MADQLCPRCGSDKIFNDECLKCGVIISRFMLPGEAPSPQDYPVIGSPIRSAIENAEEHHRRMRQSRMQTRLISTGLLLLIFLGGLAVYRTIKKGAAAYTGPYKNSEHVFGLAFAETGWSHYSQGDLNDFGIGGVADAFWRGDDPDDPEILLVVHRGSVGMRLPDPFTGDAADQFQLATRDHLQELLESAGYGLDFTSEKRTSVGGNPGFVFLADATQEEKQLEAMIYCGFRYGGLYAVIFIGTPERMNAGKTELEKIGKSLNFHAGPI